MSPASISAWLSSLPADKIEHLTCTTLLVIIIHKLGVKSIFWAWWLAVAVGVAKELADPVFDFSDLGADYIGSVLGVALCLF